MNRIKKRIIDIQQNRAQIEQIGNISFLGYYAIMVILKTFGYVSYETFYRLAFAFALIFLVVKVLTTKYTIREFLILYLLFIVGAICWLRVGEKNIMLIALTLWGMKNIDFEELLKATIGIRIVGTALVILLACVGIFDIEQDLDIGTDFTQKLVFGLGYDKPNAAFYLIFLIVALVLYIDYSKLNLWHFVTSVVLCYAAYRATFCRTGIIVFCGMWALIILDKLCKDKRYYKLLCCQVLVLFLISLFAMVSYRKANSIWYRINRMFNGRIEIGNNYYKAFGTTLGPKPAQIFWDMNATTMDNLYMYLFISCGVIVTLCFVYFTTKAQLKLYQEGHYREIIFFTVFAVYAMLEQSPFNPVLNPFILLLGNQVYRDFKIRENKFGIREDITNLTSA